MSVERLPYAQLDRAPTAVAQRRRRDRVLRRTRAAREIRDQLIGIAIVVIVVLPIVLRLTGEI
jgi:hypothetical protein